MNKKQRNKNRANADKLLILSAHRLAAKHVCENCGSFGGHWVQTRGSSLEAMITGVDDQQGFWTCTKSNKE